MTKFTAYLNDIIIQRRWVMAAILIFSSVGSLLGGIFGPPSWVTALNFVLAGMCFSGVMHWLTMPGIAKAFKDVESATMRAQIEKSLHEAWQDFVRQHPDMANMPPPRLMQ